MNAYFLLFSNIETRCILTCMLLHWCPLYLYASIMRSLYLFTLTLRSPLYAFTMRYPLPVCNFPEIPFTCMLLQRGSLYLYAFCGPLGENLSWQKLRQQSILYVDILHQLHPVLYQDVFLGLIHHQSPPLMVKQWLTHPYKCLKWL